MLPQNLIIHPGGPASSLSSHIVGEWGVYMLEVTTRWLEISHGRVATERIYSQILSNWNAESESFW